MAELVLNHILFFISGKIHSIDKERIIDLCAKFYNDFDEINEAKKVLYDCTSKKFTARRSDDKTVQTLGDIIDFLLQADKDGITLPTFVASHLSRFPQTSDGSVNLEQILHTMNIMNSRLNELQKNCVTRDMLTSSGNIYSISFCCFIVFLFLFRCLLKHVVV